MDDHEYVTRYNELYVLLERAYKDFYYLQAIGDINNSAGFEDSTTNAISHICELLKADLCLLIWKTCIDTGSDTNTLKSLKNAVFTTFGVKPNAKYFQSISKATTDAISQMRSLAIAHSVTERNLCSVKTDDLGQYLDDGIRLLNDICIKNKGVRQFDGAQMLRVRLGSEGGFRRLLENGAINKPAKTYKVITLCGSTRFKDAFLETQKRLTLEGNIVISVGLFGHSGDNEVWTDSTKEMLDDMHKRKIDMADEIFVINVGGYIGSSTASEIKYAQATGKPIKYLEALAE